MPLIIAMLVLVAMSPDNGEVVGKTTNYELHEWEPEPYVYTWKEIVLLIMLVVLICIEFKTMWTWCQWFTNCPKT